MLRNTTLQRARVGPVYTPSYGTPRHAVRNPQAQIKIVVAVPVVVVIIVVPLALVDGAEEDLLLAVDASGCYR